MNNDDTEVSFEFELPGFKLEDVKVSFEDNFVIINASKKSEISGEDDGFLRSEKREDSFFYESTLPEGVNVEKSSVSFEEGVLRVVIPKI